MQRLEALAAFVIDYDRRGKTRRQFWDAFDAQAGDLNSIAMADDADPEWTERYCEILADADDAGYTVPEERLDEPFDED